MRVKTEIKGGNNLARRLREIQERVAKNNVFVGLPKSSGNYSDGVPIVVVGTVQEYGSTDGVIPERSFLRVPLLAAQKIFSQIFKMLLPKVIDGELTDYAMLSQIGAKGVAVSQEAIAAMIPPPNAPSTIKGKGGKATPLVDTDILKSSITYVIEAQK